MTSCPCSPVNREIKGHARGSHPRLFSCVCVCVSRRFFLPFRAGQDFPQSRARLAASSPVWRAFRDAHHPDAQGNPSADTDVIQRGRVGKRAPRIAAGPCVVRGAPHQSMGAGRERADLGARRWGHPMGMVERGRGGAYARSFSSTPSLCFSSLDGVAAWYTRALPIGPHHGRTDRQGRSRRRPRSRRPQPKSKATVKRGARPTARGTRSSACGDGGHSDRRKRSIRKRPAARPRAADS